MALSPERAPSSLTSPGTSARRWEYQVFLSFRGSDTRMGFVSHLFNELERQGISTFKDDRELEGGAPISRELLSAIEDSCLAIIVLSPNYASSSWCLDELAKIVQCMDSKDSILPIFYYVDPSDVRKQLRSFAKAFETHDKNFTNTEDKEKVKQWRANLTKVAGLAGWHLDGKKSEREIIEVIVKCVRRKVQTTFQLFDSPHKFVERDSALLRLSELLDLSANDVRFIGITGMGGIGKTTLAHRVCDIISHHFDFHCFLENVREASAKDFTLLQNQLLFSIFKEKGVEFWDARRRAIFPREGLRNKKVLLVLDDVDHLDQLRKLAREKDWFGNGSRIIITTRDRRLLVEHGITLIYEVEGMSDGEAFALFSLEAFKEVQPDEEFLELSEHFVNHAKGVPLVLKVWGSSVYERDRDRWNIVLNNIQNILHQDVFDSLKISYDGLREEEKSIFLEIACFHKGKHKEQVIDILNRRFGNNASLILIDTLIERSLLTMSNHTYLEMHDLILDMGREIVLRESKAEPGKRTRIWRLDDLRYVLTTNMGTEKVEAIVVNLPNSPKLEEIRCDSNAVSNMPRLRVIELNNVMVIPWAPSAPICLPHSLRIIHWSSYPSKFLPRRFHPHYLTELRMPRNKLVRLWDGTMDAPNLKIIDLEFSLKLTTTPDFTGMPNLEILQFDWCLNLVDIHQSIAVLKRLKYLSFFYCVRIKSLPSNLEMDSLEILVLSFCRKLKKVPEFSKQMKTLSLLHLTEAAIEQLPSSIGNLVGLTYLDLDGTPIEQLPSSIGNLVGLRDLRLGSTAIEQLPSSIENLVGLTSLNLIGYKGLCVAGWPLNQHLNRLRCLESLFLSDCNLGEGAIPEDIGCLSSLSWLSLGGNHFATLPASIQCLSQLAHLTLDRCESLRELPPLPPFPPQGRSSFAPQGRSSFAPQGRLEVSVRNCTSLQRLTDPSKLSSKFANLYDFDLDPLNCVRLVEDEGFINYVLSKMVRWIISKDLRLNTWKSDGFTYPGSEIPEWFVNKSEEAGDWLGIAFCFVWATEIPHGCMSVKIEWPSGLFDPLMVCLNWPRGPEHVTMFYQSRKKCREGCPEAAEAEFSVKRLHNDDGSLGIFFGPVEMYKVGGVNMVKKWAARWVYKQDLEDLQQRLEYYGVEADSSGSDAISDDEEPNRERLKVLKRTREYYGEEAGPSGSAAISDDEEPNRKRLQNST